MGAIGNWTVRHLTELLPPPPPSRGAAAPATEKHHKPYKHIPQLPRQALHRLRIRSVAVAETQAFGRMRLPGHSAVSASAWTRMEMRWRDSEEDELLMLVAMFEQEILT